MSIKIYENDLTSMKKVKIIKHKLSDLRLKKFKEHAFLETSSSLFHYRDAVHENEPSNISVFDLVTAKEPFGVDLSVRLCVCDIGIHWV